jgi:phenylacetate-CoA ligase
LRAQLDYLYHVYQWPVIYRNQWKTEIELAAMQEKALRKLVKHAYTSVLYYHELFDSLGLKPEDVNSVSDLHLVPILTKDMILANYPKRILASGVNWSKCSPRMTSGSSGKKLEVVLDSEVAALYRLMQFRQLLDVGYKPWDKIAYIRYSPPVTSIILQKLNFFRRHYIPLEWTPEQQVSEILRVKPQIINAYPSVLYLLAKTIGLDQGKRLHLKLLMSNSELLTGHAREYIEDVFQCKVYDDYSCLEFSAIGFECKMQNLHVAADNVIVEILDPEGNQVPPGEQGRIIVTALNNFSMPYLRYEIGDIGVLSDKKCSCGRQFPVLQSIRGRSDDFVTMPSGQLVDPQTVVFQIEIIPEVKEFRVLQREDHGITVSIIPKDDADFDLIRSEVAQKLQRLFDHSVNVEVREVSTLERGSTGKHRSVISQVAPRV